MDGHYTVEKAEDGSYDIRTASGKAVREDPQSQDFLDFLSWSSTLPAPVHPDFLVPRRSVFFCEVSRLVKHLRETATFMHTSRANKSTDIEHLSLDYELRINGKHKLLNMLKAAPMGDFEGDALSAWAGEERSGFVAKPSNVYLTEDLIPQLNMRLVSDEDDVRRVSSWPIERCFVYIDVSDFSKMPPGHQAMVINSIVSVVEFPGYWDIPAAHSAMDDLEAMICIGDGYIFVLQDPLRAAFFAAYLAHLLELLVAKSRLPVGFHFRMGAHVGQVFSFWDPGRKAWNYIGEGINGGQRVLSAIGKDTDDALFISAQLRQKIIAQADKPPIFPDILGASHNRGRRSDKHGNHWRVYEVNHTNLMSRYNQALAEHVQ